MQCNDYLTLITFTYFKIGLIAINYVQSKTVKYVFIFS